MTTRDLEDRLSRYHDGELPPEEAHAIELELEREAELRAKLDGLEHAGELVRMRTDEIASDAPSEEIWERIQAKLATTSADEPATNVAATSVPATRPTLRAVEGGRSRARLWIPVAVTLAIAAAVLLVVFGRGPSGTTTGTRPGPVAGAEPPAGSEVVEVDFGYSTGAIFSIEGQEGEHYAVVWISDEKVSDEAVQ